MNNHSTCFLAIDAGGSSLKAALVRANGTIIENSYIKIPVDSDGSIDNIKATYTQLAWLGVGMAKKNNLTLEGVGVCIPGPFNYTDGICLMKHKYASIYGVPMRPWFEQVIGQVPIHFIHDSTAFILGSTWGNYYASIKRISCVIIGTGLGFASMFESKVFNNSQGGPGISIYARPYRNKIAEEYVSRRAIINQYKNIMPNVNDNIDVIDISRLAREGQSEAIKVFDDIGYNLAKILHDIMVDYRFECLLLGGAISKSADLFLPTLTKGLSDIPTLAIIKQAPDIDNAPLLGAAESLIRMP